MQEGGIFQCKRNVDDLVELIRNDFRAAVLSDAIYATEAAAQSWLDAVRVKAVEASRVSHEFAIKALGRRSFRGGAPAERERRCDRLAIDALLADCVPIRRTRWQRFMNWFRHPASSE